MTDQPVLPGFPLPGVLEFTIRVGVVPESDHLQWQFEARNPVTNELLAMESVPHFPSAMIGPHASRMTLRLVRAMREAMGGLPGGGGSDSSS